MTSDVPLPDSLVAPLMEGPLDVIGDVHGELDALRRLLRRLAYRDDGSHPEGRRLVFVGDLVDRGPDSPGVVEFVRDLMRRGRAQCVLGNHELNLLLDKRKHGNFWFYGFEEPIGDDPAVRFDSELIPAHDDARRSEFRRFFASLPLALHRDDLRIVHAAWSDPHIEQVRDERDAVAAHRRAHAATRAELGEQLRAKKQVVARLGGRLEDPNEAGELWVDIIPAVDVPSQMKNAVRVLTSGTEGMAPGRRSFWSSGRVRMVTRTPWWAAYHQEPTVIVGHYWRNPDQSVAYSPDKAGPYIFEGIHPFAWFGGAGNVFCVDYCAGRRFAERLEPGFDGQFRGSLAALRWPECELIFSDDHRPDRTLARPWERQKRGA